MRALGHHDRHHMITERCVGLHRFADLLEHPGGIHPGYVGGRPYGSLRLGARTIAHEHVCRVHGSGAHGDAHLPRTDQRIRKLYNLQSLGAAVFQNAHNSHHPYNSRDPEIFRSQAQKFGSFVPNIPSMRLRGCRYQHR